MTRKPRNIWEHICADITTLKGLEAFRVSLLLEGKDTRSARLAITLRKNQLIAARYRRLRGQAAKHRGQQ